MIDLPWEMLAETFGFVSFRSQMASMRIFLSTFT